MLNKKRKKDQDCHPMTNNFRKGGDMQITGGRHWPAVVAIVFTQPVAEQPVPPRPLDSRLSRSVCAQIESTRPAVVLQFAVYKKLRRITNNIFMFNTKRTITLQRFAAQ